MKTKLTLYIIIIGFALISCHPNEDTRGYADLILNNGKIAIMDSSNSFAESIAIKEGVIMKHGSVEDLRSLIGKGTRIIDLEGHTVIPGLNDSHLHLTRGGRFYNAELRWDGVKSLKTALNMLKEQAQRTPEGQWVRVIGGWSPFQFIEKRLPTPEEIDSATGEVPTLILFLYSRAWLNKAGLKSLGIDENTVAPPGSSFEKGADGKLTGVLLAEPNPTILYARIGSLPALSNQEIINSTQHFYRELNSFGLTSAIDAGGGGHQFPGDYSGTETLAAQGDLPIRISYFLFPQNKGSEYSEFVNWINTNEIFHNGSEIDHGFELEGGGEFITWQAGDYENFLAPQPYLEDRDDWKDNFKKTIKLLVEKRWSFRVHATYGETISDMLDVFEELNEETNGGFHEIRWLFDHAETIKESDLYRVKALGGGIAVQARMVYAGEYFIDRYGNEKALEAPPIRKMLDAGINVGAGTDGTRVASYNPWLALYWLTTGKTIGDNKYLSDSNTLTRIEALQLYTQGSAWISREEDVKGTLENGMYADLAVLSDDYFTIPESEIKNLKSILTIVAGKVVYGSQQYSSLNPILPSIIPNWSPVKYFGGYQQ